MGELLNPDALRLFLLFTAPGVVALYFRAQFLVGRVPRATDAIITYVTLSLAYQAIVYPLSSFLYADPILVGWNAVGWFVLIFFGPAVLGLLLGLNVRNGWTKKIISHMGWTTVHPIASAWDWKFSNCQPAFVMVVLKDNTKWHGFLGSESFLSSDAGERDLYIQEVFNFDEDGAPWRSRGTSVWIAHGEIQSVEFFPPS